MHLVNSMLELVNGATRVQVLGASLGAVHNCVATVKLVSIVQVVQTLLGHLITGIGNPTVSLLKDGRTQVLVSMPPVGRTGGGTTSTENTLVETIEKKTIFVRLKVLNCVVGIHLSLLLQPGLDGSVLIVEVGHIWGLYKMSNHTRDEILNDEHVRKRTDRHSSTTRGNLSKTSQTVLTVDVHGTGTANTFTTRST